MARIMARAARGAVNGGIVLCIAAGWPGAAARLVPLQKFLTRRFVRPKADP